MKRPVLVLGADEFIGRRVLARLAESDWAEPLAGVRHRTSPPGGSCRQYVVDDIDGRSLRLALEDAVAVVNCTTLSPAAIVPATRALLDAVQATDRDIRVVHVSSMSVYGSATGVVDETTELRGDLGPYSRAKVDAELIARTWPRTVVFRPGVDYGPGGTLWSIRVAQYLRARRLGDLGAAGDGCCNVVHVDDVATAIIRALQMPETDGCIYNLASAETPTWNEYLIRFARALHAGPVRRISGRWLKFESRALAFPLKAAELAARRVRVGANWLPPPIPASLLRLMRQNIRLDNSRATAELGMDWMPLDSGLQATAAWIGHGRGE